MGLNFISGSTYLMFKGASIVTTAIFSKVLFGMVIEKRHLAGCGAAIVGLVIVGASGFINASSSETDLVSYWRCSRLKYLGIS
jgi:drug/metabolite transporter (DMT)-like permease